MIRMTQEKLNEILELHKKWIKNEPGGTKANLSGADLSGADLCGANLSWVNLSGADLSVADLSGADLYGANLSWVNLSGADLSVADLSGADLYVADLSGANMLRAYLSGANLYGANLSGANLSGANLYGANLSGANLYGVKANSETKVNNIDRYFPQICPSHGAFIGWKKAQGMIVKLQITEDAKRSSAFGRKCRCSKAIVLGIENKDGTQADVTFVVSDHDNGFVYEIGKTVEVANFCKNREIECAPGIHFFITRQEAVYYQEVFDNV